MAIYQAPKKRWRLALITCVVGAIAGLLIGLAIGRGGTDPLAAIRDLDTRLEDAAAPLDVLVIHGEADTGTTNARVVVDAVARTQERFAEVRDAVAAINDDAVDAFDEHVETLRRLAQEDPTSDEIAEEAEELAGLLRDVIRA